MQGMQCYSFHTHADMQSYELPSSAIRFIRDQSLGSSPLHQCMTMQPKHWLLLSNACYRPMQALITRDQCIWHMPDTQCTLCHFVAPSNTLACIKDLQDAAGLCNTCPPHAWGAINAIPATSHAWGATINMGATCATSAPLWHSINWTKPPLALHMRHYRHFTEVAATWALYTQNSAPTPSTKPKHSSEIVFPFTVLSAVDLC